MFRMIFESHRLCFPELPAVLFVTVLMSMLSPGRSLSQVTINEDGVLLVNGKKVLPIGFSNGPPPDGRTPDGRSAYAEIKAAGGTFFRTGVMGGDKWDQKTIEREHRVLDTAARHGLYCWLRLRELSSLEANNTEKEIPYRGWEHFKSQP